MMNTDFATVVEGVKQLSLDEKQELHDLIESYLIEERRDEIVRNFEASRAESGSLEFSSDIERLKESLNG
jgi:hypothetical protein